MYPLSKLYPSVKTWTELFLDITYSMPKLRLIKLLGAKM